jgi:hypothetical protein
VGERSGEGGSDEQGLKASGPAPASEHEEAAIRLGSPGDVDGGKGKLARELREILAELAKAELAPVNVTLLEGVDL